MSHKNLTMSDAGKKKIKPFQFPPLPSENITEINKEVEQNDNKKTQTDPISEDLIPLMKLTRKNKKIDHQGNLSTISADYFRSSIINPKPFEFTKSLQDIKNIEENQFEDFEDEDRRAVASSVQIDKINSKFVLRNIKLSGIAECPLKIENLSIPLSYNEIQKIILCFVIIIPINLESHFFLY